MAIARDQVLAWIRRETARRRLEEDEMRPVELPPPEAFSDEYTPVEALLRLRPHADPDETGPESRAVRIVIGRRCCGWRTRPTTREVYDALRAGQAAGRGAPFHVGGPNLGRGTDFPDPAGGRAGGAPGATKTATAAELRVSSPGTPISHAENDDRRD